MIPLRCFHPHFRRVRTFCKTHESWTTLKKLAHKHHPIRPSPHLPFSTHQYEEVSPWPLARPHAVPTHIPRPDYTTTPYGIPSPVPKQIEVKTAGDITRMRAACRLVRDVMDHVGRHVTPGVRAEELDEVAHSAIVARGAYPSPLGYRNFPRSSCLSVNNVVCHGIPDTRPLKDGDVVSLDVTVFHEGFHGDHCRTFAVGDVDDEGRRLIDVTLRCLNAGVSACGPNIAFSAIGTAIEDLAQDEGFTVVPYFNGHGIGSFFHGPPDVRHYANSDITLMRPGMTFTIEPVICEGDGDAIRILDDGWTAITEDGSRAAQFEHTVLVTEDGVEVLTK